MSETHMEIGIGQEISDGWLHLERLPARQAVDQWCVFELSFLIDGRHLLLGLDAQGNRHLLIPMGDANRPDSNLRSPLAVSCSRYDFGPESHGYYLDIHCRLVELNSQFHQVIVDVVKVVQDAPEPIRAASLVVARWRKLLGTLFVADVLTYRQRISLFAELAVYEALLGSKSSTISPTMWWGPDNSPHDFELETCSIEVKAIGADSTDIKIHGFDQLAEYGGKQLHLAIVQVEEDREGRSLSELARSLMDRTPEFERGELERRLRRAGVPLGVGANDSLLFLVTRVFHIPVDDRIPKITPAQLVGGRREGICRLEYAIPLTILESHPDGAAGFVRPGSGE
ncbi:PD-(D/E)XK motif protein [Rhodococcus hoagii]|nr:PD-(D/E)XK motif protein [Prescottella equi]